MKPTVTPTVLIISLVAILLMHLLAIHFYVYWTVTWFDSLMHFLGGLWVGVTALTIYGKVGMSNKQSILWAVLGALSVGILWELFEYTIGMIFSPGNYALDTATDLIMDVVGGAAAYFYLTYVSVAHE